MDRYLAFLRGGFPKPVIAAVNGSALAGGFELMLGCDLAVVADHAVFGIPEARRGLVAAGGGVLLPLRIPLAVALELGLTGDPIDAGRALQLGLVNRVVPGPSVMDEAMRLAERIGQNGPLAVALTKKLMHEVARYGGADAWERVAAANSQVFDSEDAIEGSRAFAERRPPVWKGR
jgi:enoyl-CoA hydratase